MVIRRPTQIDVIEWLLLLTLFYSHGAGILNVGSSLLATVLGIVLVVFAYRTYQASFPKYILVAFSLLLCNFLMTGFLGSASLSTGFNFAGWFERLFIYLAVFLLYSLDPDVFRKYLKLVIFFSVISLACYAIVTAGHGNIFTSLFPSVWGPGGTRVFHGKIFFAYCASYDRNTGVFVEPGIFQIPLVMCLYASLFFYKNLQITSKQRFLYLIILLVTIITTKSATAYIGVIIILTGYVLYADMNKGASVILIIACIAAFMYIDYVQNGAESLLSTYLIDKLNNTASMDFRYTSGGARLLVIQLGIQSALENPFGIGYLRWDAQIQNIYGGKFGTGNALFGELGVRGFLSFGVMLYLVLKPMVTTIKRFIPLVVCVALFINISLAQAKILYPSILMVALMLYNELPEERKFSSYVIK